MAGFRPPFDTGTPPIQAPSSGAPFNITRSCEPPRQRARSAPGSREEETLGALIEGEIIPRLMLLHVTGSAGNSPSDGSQHVRPDDVTRLTRLALVNDFAGAIALVDEVRGRGVPVATLLSALLTPVARRMGRMWEADTASFVEVTVGMTCLQGVLRRLRPSSVRRLAQSEVGCRPEASGGAAAPSILLLPAPGEQHSFGLLLVEDSFCAAGWEVWGGLPDDTKEVRKALKAKAFSAIGYSLGSHVHADRLALTITWARQVSRNPGVTVLVGGAAVAADPDLATRVGADAWAGDAREAVTRAEALVAPRHAAT